MNLAEDYLEFLKEIYGADVVDKCIKTDKTGLLSIDKKAIYFKKDNKKFAPDRCEECGENLFQALPGWLDGLDISKDMKYFVLGEDPNPLRTLVTSYRVGLRDPNKYSDEEFDPGTSRYHKLKGYLDKVIPNFDIEKSYISDAAKCNIKRKYGTKSIYEKKWKKCWFLYLSDEISYVNPTKIIIHGPTARNALNFISKHSGHIKESSYFSHEYELKQIDEGEVGIEYGVLVRDGETYTEIPYLKIPRVEEWIKREEIARDVLELLNKNNIQF